MQALPEVLPGLIGRSKKMRAMARLVTRCAATNVSVLLRGESGTGKEAVARAVHVRSRRPDGPFVVLSGALLGGDLGLSSLLGHVRGAFTGAAEGRLGALRRADGGTLFIDEVGSLSAASQARLLRVVENGLCEPIGADRAHVVDVRLVTATCEALEHQVERGEFRLDLYQRISGCVVELPPLRERGLGDLRLLVEHISQAEGIRPLTVCEEALELLSHEHFAGNVRELRNILVHAAMLTDGKQIGSPLVAAALSARAFVRQPRKETLDFRAILDANNGNISAAARHAGLPRSTFRDWLRRGSSDPRRELVSMKRPAPPALGRLAI